MSVNKKTNQVFICLLPWLLFCASTGRADPNSMLGHILKMLFRNDDFTNAVRNLALVWDYLSFNVA